MLYYNNAHVENWHIGFSQKEVFAGSSPAMGTIFNKGKIYEKYL